MRFLLEGPGGLPGAKQARAIATDLPFTFGQDVTFSGNVTVTGTLNAGAEVITSEIIASNSATAFAVGPNGSTNPGLLVDGSQASAANGLRVRGVIAGSGLQLAVISSATNDGLFLDSKGSGAITVGQLSTGLIAFKNQGVFQSNNAQSFTVGPSAFTNPVFNVDSSTASSANGLNIKGAATGGTVLVTVIDSGSNSSLSIGAKGTGTITLQPSIATPAGGSAAASLRLGSTAGLGVYFGSGAPTVTAAQGSLYMRSDGSSTSTRMYVNTDGGTTWTAVTTAA